MLVDTIPISPNRARIALPIGVDGRTAAARRFRDVLAGILADLGPDATEGERQLARRAATLAIACEQVEAQIAAGDLVDVDAYGVMVGRLGRVLGQLGLKRSVSRGP